MSKDMNVRGFMDLADKHRTYLEFRKEAFKKIGALEKDVRHWEELMRANADLPCIMFEPKKILYYKDRYYCESNTVARKVMQILLKFPDVDWCEVKHRWASVDFTLPKSERHYIEGQTVDERERIRKV